jgi:CheY-like chemotaxis protein
MIDEQGGFLFARIIRVRILLIDNDPLVLSTIRTVLELDGHDVVGSASGHDGIALFEAALVSPKPFSVVITDLGMPEMDGRQVAQAVKKRSQRTPVILLTGWGEQAGTNRSPSSDFDRVLGKPPRIRDLRAALMDCTVPT